MPGKPNSADNATKLKGREALEKKKKEHQTRTKAQPKTAKNRTKKTSKTTG